MARNECYRRLRAAVPSAPLYAAAAAMDDTGQLSAITEQAELRALVRAALAELDPVEREISELNLRYGLIGADLGGRSRRATQPGASAGVAGPCPVREVAGRAPGGQI